MGRNCQGTKGTPSGPSKNQALGRFLWYLSISRWFPLEMTGDSAQPPINNPVLTIKSGEGREWRREDGCFDSTSSFTHMRTHTYTRTYLLNPGALPAHTFWPGAGMDKGVGVKWGVESCTWIMQKGVTRGWQRDDGVHQAVGAPVLSSCLHPPQHWGN